MCHLLRNGMSCWERGCASSVPQGGVGGCRERSSAAEGVTALKYEGGGFTPQQVEEFRAMPRERK